LHIGYQDSNNKDRYTNLNLPNATVSLSTSGAQLALDQDDNYQDTTTLTIKTLNGVAGTYVRAGGQALYFDPPGYSTITVGDGVFQGVIGTNTTSYPCFNNISLIKNTTGTLTLSGANTYTGGTTVSGGVLELTGDAIVANGQVYVDTNGTLKYSWNGSGDKTLTIDAVAKKIYGTGKVIVNADEEAVLKIYTSAKGMIDVQSLTISSGRVDIKDYFDGQLIVKSGAQFSPGNSVGTLIIGDGVYGDGGFILNEAGAELLMEIAGSAPSANDGLIVAGPITLADNSIITLVNNSNLGLGESFTAILSAENSANLDVLGHIQTTDFTDLKYETVTYLGNTVYAITGRTFNANEVPEPSTWALLILGAAGLLYWRKKKNA
jgi:autotransporter-associated beta strand protein